MIFPWQAEQWQHVLKAKKDNRLPHALLLMGMPGMGKAIFAHHFSRLLLCQQQAEDGCACHSCRLIAGRAHPNVLWIEPEKAGQAIKVDQVREISDFVNHSSFHEGDRIVLIHPADAMNMSAANALLKTLEEPSSGALLVLIADHASRLPATILSRCQRILFPTPKKADALHWLASQITDDAIQPEQLYHLAHGAPLAALKLIEADVLTVRQDLYRALYALSEKKSDPLTEALQGKEAELLPWVDCLLSWLKDLAWLQLTNDQSSLMNHDYARELSELKQKTVLKKNMTLMECAQQIRGQLSLGINLNKQLVMESLLIKWAEGV